jgi:2-oxoisovalerate dehydrogenase E1 component beta subunit
MATLSQSIRMALHYAEENLQLTNIFGQDVGPPLGGVFTGTQGLKTAWNTPLDERGIVGAAIGLAMAGQRCVAEIQFCDYIFNALDLLMLAGKTCWSSYGDWNLPMTVMTPVGSGIRGSIYHSHSFDAVMTHIPGWKIVMPSNPKDGYGLLLSCLRDPNPTMYLMPKALMYQSGEELIPGEPASGLKALIDKPVNKTEAETWRPRWPEGLTDYTVPLGKGKIVREGADITVVSYGRLLPVCVKAATQLAAEGVNAEVIDMRSLWPYDWELISASILKTQCVVYVNEDTEVTNFGEHLIRRTIDELFYHLAAPPKLLAGAFIPGIGLAHSLEMASVPQLNDIIKTVHAVIAAKV